jgi:hypothetical protein
MRATFISVAALALAACTPASNSEKPAEAPATSAVSATGPVGFAVNVTVSDKAIEKMVADGDKMRVSATYFGAPKPGATPSPDPTRVALGDQFVETNPASQVVKITGAFDAEMAKTIEGEPRVLVNVVSTDVDRGRYPMECTIFEGALKEAAALGDAGVAITCKAFGEP